LSDAIGAIDGVHTPVSPPEAERAKCRNRKGQLSLNHLAACDFDMRFTYILSGWEGSVADGFLFSKAISSFGLEIPRGKYYLADAGFAMVPGMLIPFRGVRYHLREWAQGNQKPQNRNELYNLRHASARNVIERVFGVMKRRFKIIREANGYDLKTNAKVMSALVALHNFLRHHDADDIPEPWTEDDDDDNPADNETGATGQAATRRISTLRDGIADAMWEEYSAVIAQRRATRRAQADRRRASLARARALGQIPQPARRNRAHTH